MSGPVDDHGEGHGSDADPPDDPLGSLRGVAGDDPRVQAGLGHLQNAARELIAGSRALLDVAEDLVEDPGAVAGLVGLLGSVGDLAGRLGRPTRAPWAHPGPGDGDWDDPDDEDPPVQRIPVS